MPGLGWGEGGALCSPHLTERDRGELVLTRVIAN